MLSRLTAHKRISTGAEIGQRLGFTADAIDPRIEAIQHDDWKATTALKLSVAVFGRRAVHEVAENASGLGRRQSTASNADHEPNCATKGRTRRTRKKSRYYEVAMLRTATSTTTTVRLPIRCQQATST
jgi:hypothetical protein